MGFGRGKVILLGEHAVVYGHPAIAAGLERGVQARARVGSQDRLVLSPWEMTVAPDLDSEEPLSRALAVALSGYRDRPALEIEAVVSLPAGAGLGCSAAIGVAVLDAIDEALEIRRTRADLGEEALAWEQVFHGNPSGIDNTMAALGGVARYHKGQRPHFISLERPLQLVIGDSGETSSTRQMVASVAAQRDADPSRVDEALSAIASLVSNAELALRAGNLAAVGQLMDLNQTMLSSFLLSTSKLEEMCQAARAAGALGAKLTGAGGGGCMIALVPDEQTATAVRSVLGPRAFLVEIGAQNA